jgi:ribosome-associated protein
MIQNLDVGDRPINLTQVLKRAGWAAHGAAAKALIADGQVLVNGAVELRKRRQMAVGDTVQVRGGPCWRLAAGAPPAGPGGVPEPPP